jgi:1-deoxy-D-xylulose-5-phosphate reductoisomerase
MNAANEVASQAFIDGKIRFTDIPVFIEKTLDQQSELPIIEDVEEILKIHKRATQFTEEIIRKNAI